AEPIVWTMLFSRMVEPPSRLSTEIASTAIGMEALTVRPALSPRYTVDAPKINPNTAPSSTALTVNSAGDCVGGMYGVNVFASAGATVRVVGEWAMGASYPEGREGPRAQRLESA